MQSHPPPDLFFSSCFSVLLLDATRSSFLVFGRLLLPFFYPSLLSLSLYYYTRIIIVFIIPVEFQTSRRSFLHATV